MATKNLSMEMLKAHTVKSVVDNCTTCKRKIAEVEDLYKKAMDIKRRMFALTETKDENEIISHGTKALTKGAIDAIDLGVKKNYLNQFEVQMHNPKTHFLLCDTGATREDMLSDDEEDDDDDNNDKEVDDDKKEVAVFVGDMINNLLKDPESGCGDDIIDDI